MNYDPALTSANTLTDAVQGLGAGVIQFQHLSMLAALATPSQISAIEGLTGVQSVYLNQQLRYLLAESIPAIRADAVHADGVTGAGARIAILDTGIDGLYRPDVAYPDRTVANVKFIADSRDLYEVKGVPAVAASLFIENRRGAAPTAGRRSSPGR